MLIYFTASIVGKKHYLSHYEKILKILSEKGITHLSDHIMKTSSQDLLTESEAKQLDFHKKLDDWISQADAVVAETSYPSISVGYEIALALSKGKPVLVLYSSDHLPSLLLHTNSEKLVCEKYTSSDLAERMNDFLEYIKGSIKPRLTFFISQKIDHYLENITKEQKIPKSVFIRQLIEREMKKS
jgi:hypothetical protein